MSLIDNDNFDQKIEKDNKNAKCKECSKSIPSDAPVLLCENCFNNSIRDVLNKTIENIQKINEELTKVNSNIKIIENELEKNKQHHIIVLNKLEIDLLNFKAIRDKFLIDKNLNMNAFKINQIQANKLRELMKWSLYDIKEIDNELK